MSPNSLPQKGLYTGLYRPLTPGGDVPGLKSPAIQKIVAPLEKNKGLGQYLGDAVKTTVPGLAVALIAGLVAWFVLKNKGAAVEAPAENEYDTADEQVDDEEEVGVGRFSY